VKWVILVQGLIGIEPVAQDQLSAPAIDRPIMVPRRWIWLRRPAVPWSRYQAESYVAAR